MRTASFPLVQSWGSLPSMGPWRTQEPLWWRLEVCVLLCDVSEGLLGAILGWQEGMLASGEELTGRRETQAATEGQCDAAPAGGSEQAIGVAIGAVFC